MLRRGLEHVVLESNEFATDIQRVLSPNQVHVVVKLVIVGSDLRGTVGGIPECSVARKRENRQPIGKRIAWNFHTRNAKLCGKIQPRVLVCGNHKES